MATTPEELIAAIHASLNTLMGVTIPYGIGEQERHKHSKPPLVTWVDQPSEIAPIASAGGNPTPIHRELSRWQVYIWHDSRANVRALHMNLLVAARKQSRAIRWGRYEVDPIEHTQKGALIVADVELEFIVLDQVVPTVVADFAQTGGYLDDTLVTDTTQDLRP